MPYFVKIGAIPSNASGVGSRGYHLYRRGCRITTVWGGVEVRPGRRFYWVHTTQHKKLRCNSPEAAVRKAKALIALRAESRGYSRLPAGARIRRHANSRRSSRRR